MVQTPDIMITSLEEIHVFDFATQEYLFTLDELQNAKLTNAQEVVELKGKGERLINTLKKNKSTTFSGTNGLLSSGLLEAQVGSDFVQKKSEILVAENQVVNSDKAATNFKAVGTTGAEIAGVRVSVAGGDNAGKKFTQDSTASGTGKFAYDPESKAITFFAGDIPDGTEIIVIYKRKVDTPVLDNVSDKYSKKATVYMDALGEDTCGKVYRLQVRVPKADFSGNFDLDFGGNQNVHAWEVKALAGACGTAGVLWDLAIFGIDIKDAV